MNFISIIISIVVIIFAVIFIPIILFILYLMFDSYNKFYLNLVGQGNKWYQNLFLIPAGFLTCEKRRFIKNNLNLGNNKNHIAIILANNYFPENIFGFGMDNAVYLIKYLKENKKTYRVYNKVTAEKIKKIIKDKKAKSIFLFGHGQRHGIKVGRNEAIYYCEFPKSPKRNLIAQFHCNHLNGKCLGEYGKKPIYNFVLNKTQNQIDIQKQLKEIIKRKLI